MKDRTNAMTIRLLKFPNIDFGNMLNEISCETAWGYQHDFKKYDIVWIDKGVTSEFFKYIEYFDWLPNFNGGSGKSGLWYNGGAVTKDNYRTAVYNDEELNHYEYLPYDEMINTPPIVDEEI